MTTAAQPAPAPSPLGRSATARPLLELHLAGDQATMGAQHGRLLRARGDYDGALAFYPRLPRHLLAAGHRDLGTAALLRTLQPALAVALKRLERDRPPAYLARSRAFMAALGRPPGDARYLLVMDLVQNVIGLAARIGLGPFARHLGLGLPGACSSLAVWDHASDDGRLLHARNFDFPGVGIWDRWPTVVFCSPDDGLRYGFVTTRGADVPGVTAFNEAGLTVTAHTRFHRDVAPSGASVIDLGHDIIRRADSLAGAVAIARERRVASTWGLLVSSARERRAVHIETTGARTEASWAARERPALWCANRYHHHALTTGDASPSPAWRRFSDGREVVMARRVARLGRLTVADLQDLLCSHETPDDAGTERAAGGVLAQPITVQSVVADPERRQLHVAIGEAPASRGPWLTLPWRWRAGGTWALHSPSAATPGRQRRYTRGAEGEAYAALAEATRLDGAGAPEAAVDRAISRAVALDPDEPTYRLLAAGFALRKGAFSAACAHFARGLAAERSEFRRGELWLWGARAADALGDRATARAYRAALRATADPLLAEARADAERPYPARKLRRVVVDLTLVSLHE